MNIKKKILIVCTSPKMLNYFMVEHIIQLSKKFDVSIATNTRNDSLYLKKIEKYSNIFNIPISRNINFLLDLLTIFFLMSILFRGNYTIVLSISPKAGIVSALAGFLCRTKIRIHIYTGQVWYTKKGIYRELLKKVDQFISFLSTRVFIDSFSQKDFLIEQKVVKKKKGEVINNGSISGVNLKKFKPNIAMRKKIRQSLKISDYDVVFIYVGRLKIDKGLIDLAEAFSHLEQKNKNIRLLLVGDDEDNIKSRILNLINDSEKCNFINFNEHPEKYMAAADIFCLPSYREGFGSTIIEAAAVGIPSIGSNIYGIQDAISDKETGILFRSRDVGSLENAMLLLMQNDKLRIKLGHAARENVKRNFNSYEVSNWLVNRLIEIDEEKKI